ncbi:MAG: ABC transporter ATP-binding protein [Thiohalomonadales bacterium]
MDGDNIPFSWRSLFRAALAYRNKLILAQCIAFLAVLVSVPIPLLMPLLVDEVLLDNPATLVATMRWMFPAEWHGPILFVLATLALTMLLRLSMLVLNVWQLQQFTFISKQITFTVREKLLYLLQRVSMAEFETLGSGTVSSHLVTDVNAIDDFLGAAISKAIIAVLSLVGISAILLWMHWQLALFILLMNPAVIYFTVLLGSNVKQLKHKENQAIEVFQQSLNDTLDAIQQIRSSNREKYYIGGVIDSARRVKQHSASFAWKSDAANRFSFGIFLFGFDIFRAVTMLMVIFSDLSIGEMMAVFGYLWFMMAPVQEILNVQYAFYAAKAALSRINALFLLQQEPDYVHKQNPFTAKNTLSLTLENLVFSYQTSKDGEDDRAPLLNKVNLHVPAGQKIAMVGASGGGKSTLVQVILGLYPSQSGQIYFDGIPVSEIGLDVVRENVATVLQHPALFNDTVRNNLSLGRSFTEAELERALAIAQLSSTVAQLPQGLDTIIGRQGVRLSGGQRQRLAIARMILSDPKLVILDEATSALDTETEARLHHALNQYLQQRTTLIIAHRLSAVRQADRVIVFEAGRIIEDGTHEQLISSEGLYNRLYSKYKEY